MRHLLTALAKQLAIKRADSPSKSAFREVMTEFHSNAAATLETIDARLSSAKDAVKALGSYFGETSTSCEDLFQAFDAFVNDYKRAEKELEEEEERAASSSRASMRRASMSAITSRKRSAPESAGKENDALDCTPSKRSRKTHADLRKADVDDTAMAPPSNVMYARHAAPGMQPPRQSGSEWVREQAPGDSKARLMRRFSLPRLSTPLKKRLQAEGDDEMVSWE